MSKTAQKYRDAVSGEFVSKAHADANPGTTIGESKSTGGIWKLVSRLDQEGGWIVRAADLSKEDVAAAKADGRFWGGLVYEPAGK